ncbi:hypothetical protein MTR72_16095 [Bradyrhizobium sp. ISRA442]|uniref:hypothetical protein n=1 Tax=Bradyrhizobium sp. ISRA442 TaxID=2866197 RepID=UPI00311B20C0
MAVVSMPALKSAVLWRKRHKQFECRAHLPGKEITMARHRLTTNPYTRPAIFTLERLHAELGGAILENRQKHEELSEQMRHVKAVIKMLDPAYNLAGINVKRRKPNRWVKRGTLYRRAL